MGSEETRFDALVIASIGVVGGVAYVLWGMLALLSDGGSGIPLLMESVPLTTAVGVVLTLAAGLLGTGSPYGRYLGILGFGAVAVFGRPALGSPEPVLVAQTALALGVALYMVVQNPVANGERSPVDESTSATRIGSTIR